MPFKRRNRDKTKRLKQRKIKMVTKILRTIIATAVSRSDAKNRQYNEKEHVCKDNVWFKKPNRSYSRLYQYLYDYRPIDYGGDSNSD